MIVVLISAQYYDSTADCDLSLAMMEDLIYNESIFFIEKQSFHGGTRLDFVVAQTMRDTYGLHSL